MPDTPEQAELRRHLAEMRRAASGLGRDFEIGFRNLDDKISRLPAATAQEVRELVLDIDDDFRRFGRTLDEELSKMPGRVSTIGAAIAGAAVRAGATTLEAFQAAGKRTREGTRNAFAAAAGVKRTPMRAWHPPGGSSDDESDR